MCSGGQNRNNNSRTTSGDVESQNLVPQSHVDEAESNKERRDQLQKEAFQLANYYFVFQGVIFTAFYNAPSDLKCEYHWVPFALSLLAGFLNLCALCSIAFKYKTTLDAIDATVMITSTAADERGNHAPRPVGGGGDEPIAVKCERHWRFFYVVGCLCLFVGFFVITLIGCWLISCGGTTHN